MTEVVVTGIGFVNALGRSTQDVWSAVVAGKSAIKTISTFDPSKLRTQVAGAAPDPKIRRQLPHPRGSRLMNRASQFAVAGLIDAIADAQLDLAESERAEVAVYLASENQISDPQHVLPVVRQAWDPESEKVDYHKLGQSSAAMYPLFFLEGLPGAALYFASEQFGFAGPNAFYSGSADAGANTITSAYRCIRYGNTEVAVAGAFDDVTSWWPTISTDVLDELAPAGADDIDAYRPFAADAAGRLLGDGACMLVLESLAHAQARGARIYATIDGVGAGRFSHMRPGSSARGFGTAIRQSLAQATGERTETGVVYSSGAAHTTADSREARAIAEICGDPLVTCAHPATGHQMSAAGPFNVALAALSIFHGVIPPTLNTHRLANYAPTQLVTGQAVHTDVHWALALADGVHGQASAISLRSVDSGDITS